MAITKRIWPVNVQDIRTDERRSWTLRPTSSTVVCIRQQVGDASLRTLADPKVASLSSQTSMTTSATVIDVRVEVDADTQLGGGADPRAVGLCCSVLTGRLIGAPGAVCARGALAAPCTLRTSPIEQSDDTSSNLHQGQTHTLDTL